MEEEFTEDIYDFMQIVGLSIIVFLVLLLILIIIAFIVNARRHDKVSGWIAYTQTLCKEIKTDNNTKYEKINKTLFSYFDSVKSRETTIINSLSDLAKEIQILKKNTYTIDANVNRVIDIQKDSHSKLNSVFNELKQSTISSLDKVYHSNNDWLNKNIQELLNNDTQLKQKSETLGNNFVKYNSELQQKLDSLKKEQIENWKQHLEYLKSFEEKILKSEIINRQIQKTVSNIEEQEQILNGMVKQHTVIADYAKEIVESQEGIVKLLEALMLDTLTKEIDKIKK
jgi:hypothetical protein